MIGQIVHVVAGVLRDAHGRVLLAQRPDGKHLAGLWEFPGGKCEPGEAPEQALRRELREELGIEVGVIEKLIAIPWHYPGKRVLLDVMTVLSHGGEVCGCEGQPLRWVALDELKDVPMPAADRPVVAALTLPPHYVISAEPDDDAKEFLSKLQCVLDAGEKCIQLRSKQLPRAHLRALAQAASELAQAAGADLLLNGDIDLAQNLGLGVHLPASELLRLRDRPLDSDSWVAASCHDERELVAAVEIGVDFAVLGPVQHTPSHAGMAPLGWSRFAELCAQAPFPVYALGGLSCADLGVARQAGAQGIAGISAFWSQRG